MNKKVLKVMVGLVIAFLVSDYILKFFFPEEFIMIIDNKRFIEFGAYVDTHLYVHMLLGMLTSSITYYLYLGATTRRYTLKWYEILLIILISTGTQYIYYFVDINICSAIHLLAMLLLPILGHATLKDTAIVFTIHYCAQWLSINIRSLPALLPAVNYATILALTAECYFWLLLLYLYNNIKKEDK